MQSLNLNGLTFELDMSHQKDRIVFKVHDEEARTVTGTLPFAHVKELCQALIESIPVSEWAKYPKVV